MDRKNKIAGLTVIIFGLMLHCSPFAHSEESTIEKLIEQLRSDNSSVRVGAVCSLSRAHFERTTRLIAALEDKNAFVREQAAWALGEREEWEAVPGLISVMEDKNSNVRRGAAWALGQIKDPLAVNALVKALKDKNSHVRENAAWSLRLIKDKRATGPLVDALDDKNRKIRFVAVSALKAITGKNFGRDAGKWRKWHEESKLLADNKIISAAEAGTTK